MKLVLSVNIVQYCSKIIAVTVIFKNSRCYKIHFGNDIWRVFFEKSIFLEHFYAGFSVTFPATFLSFIRDDFWDFYYIDVIFILRRFLYVFLYFRDYKFEIKRRKCQINYVKRSKNQGISTLIKT